MTRGPWRWEKTGARKRRLAQSTLWQWEYGALPPGQRFFAALWKTLRAPAKILGLGALAFLFGAAVVSGPDSALANAQLRAELRRTEGLLKARQGELALTRLELDRLSVISDYSTRHRIPADLAERIYDIALAEGVDPALAFSLVRVESEFTQRAVSSAGAVGFTQLMPSTAFEMQPGLMRSDLFDRDTNLRLGFRYLRQLLHQYDGDLRLALLAYNRGPGRVDGILKEGGDPGNGYARSVMRGVE